MAIPTFDKFLYPFLVAVDAQSLSSKEIREAVAKDLNLSDADRALTTKSGKKLQYVDRIDWSLQYLRRAGMVEVDGYKWKSTKRGHDYLKTHSDLTRDDLMAYPEFVEFISGIKSSTSTTKKDEDLTPSEQFEAAYQKIKQSLADELLNTIMNMSPKFFEKLVVDLMMNMGYGNPENPGRTTQFVKDDGIDGIIYQDRLGLDKIYIQARRWTNSVGKPDIQQFAGALEEKGATKGVFFTTSTFSKEAYAFVEKASKKIILIDGNNLANFMIDYDLGVSFDRSNVYTIKHIDKDYFEE